MVVKKNIVYIIFAFLILMDNCFYLINTDAIHITGSFAYSDIWLVAFALFFFWQFVKYIRIHEGIKYKEKYLIIALCILVFVSAYQQMKLTGQGLNLGIRPQRNYLIILLSYFPIRKLFALKKLDPDEVMQGVMKLGTFAAALYILQKLVYPNAQFIYAAMNYRNGTLRMYIETSVVQLAGMVAMYYFCKNFKIKYLIFYIINFVDIFWVGQGRLEIMSFLAASAIGVVLVKELDTKRFLIVVTGIVAVFIFLNTSFADSFWEAVLSAGTARTDQGNTMAIRYIGRELYFKQLGESVSTMLFGCGYPNFLYMPAANKAGYNVNINLNDNGIFGFTYVYGFVGLAVLLILFIRLIVRSVYVFKKTNNNFFVMYFSMLFLLAYNVIMWYWYAGGTFILIIMICILEEAVACIKKNGNCAEKMVNV